MKEIRIPFKEIFRLAMVSGQKICTMRTRIYGQRGDQFEAFGKRFELVIVIPVIAFVAGNFLYREEGFEQPGEFHKLWEELHPRLDSNAIVFLHVFKLVPRPDEAVK